jgi:TFIIF-interacting CTD phosphatase-like protein
MDKKLLILDLDGTLLHCLEVPNLIFDLSPEEPTNPYSSCPEKNEDSFTIRGRLFWLRRRPYLDEFLRSLSSFGYELAIWTASDPTYAFAVIHRIWPNDIPLKFIWTFSQCDLMPVSFSRQQKPSERKFLIRKDLRKVWRHKSWGYNKCNTLILDDTPSTYSQNYNNAIPIKSYLGESDDTELKRLLPICESLMKVSDVRSDPKC